MSLPSEPITRKEQYLAKAAGQAVEIPAEPITREEAYLDAIAKGSGGGGTKDYSQLDNKPQINGTTLTGNKSASDLSLASVADLANKVDKVDGKGLSTNDFTDEYKTAIGANTTAISGIKDGQNIDSFADVESALSNKQDTLTFDDVPIANSDNPVKSGGVKSAIDTAVASAYHHAGTKTCAELIAGLLVSGNEGNVYNMTDSGTTTADFIEGAGQPIKAGDNVGIAKISDGVYKFDLLSGFVDTTNFVQKSSTAGLIMNDGTIDTVAKQPVTDNTLETTDKTVSGAINEVNAWTSASTKSVTGNPITITDAAAVKAKALSMTIEPVQDLHGYDKPWVGGSGKNKLPMTVDMIKAINTSGTWSGNVYSGNGATITILTDSDNNVTGIKAEAPNTPSDTVQFNLCYKGTGDTFNDIENTSVTMNGCPSGGSENTYYIQFYKYDGTYQVKDTSGGVTFTPSNIPADARVRITIKSAIPSGGVIFYPMIRLATETDATFAPYTNICPITGRTEASVQRDGKNYIDSLANETYDSYGTIISNAARAVTKIMALNAGTYAVSVKTSAAGKTPYISISTWANGTYGTNTRLTDTNWQQVQTTTITLTEDGYVSALFKYSDDTNITISDISAQIEVGSNPTPIEPYVEPQTYTIQLGDTIYGGEVDFNSGVMTVDRAIVDLGSIGYSAGTVGEGTLFYSEYNPFSNMKNTSSAFDVSNALCSSMIVAAMAYVNSGDIEGLSIGPDNARVRVFSNSTYKNMTPTEFKSAMDGVQLCYELATSFTVQLTPTQIQLLKGTNTITANGASISLTYQQDNIAGEILEQVEPQIDDLQEQIDEIPRLVDYSTTEQKTGQKWIDGRDIYVQVIDLESDVSVGTSWAVTSVLSGNRDICVDARFIASNGNLRMQPSVSFAEEYIRMQYMYGTDSGRYLTIFYTKTTT